MKATGPTLVWNPAAPRPAGAVPWTRPTPPPYLADPVLVEVVNVALYLERRPLLLRGEPGSGKTRLAERLAYDLGLHYEEWYVKSTSRARDGLYVYDAIGRLRDAYEGRLKDRTGDDPPAVADAHRYVSWGPLGRALRNPGRTVVLIDEIDKADIDFPNDLLRELDEQRFTVEETNEVVEASAPPIVIVTSNNEKDLPDAFLRRCLFHYIDFPSRQRLTGIVDAHFPQSPPAVVEAAVQRFEALRKQMVDEKGVAGKRVSTSELIDWFAALRRLPDDEVLTRLEGRLPYPSVLLKAYEDHLRYLDGGPGAARDDG